ncbi:MAG: hypothetical protein JXB39_08980 [Deltaproteobacteria bacterium]|nr:hypothetical protein [Deltaproteobacteria bacterium]
MTHLALVALLSASAGHAVPTMWGIGPRLGTNVIPGRYPVAWPSKVKDQDTLEKVGGDVLFGAEGDYWANEANRVGALLGLDLGADYASYHFLLKYDRIIPFDALEWYLGAGAGVSTHRWSSQTEAELKVPAYPLRGQTGVLIRQGSVAYQVQLHAQYDVPGHATYLDAEGVEVDVGWGLYFQIGAELSVLFGDFVPPKKRTDDTGRRRR